MQIAQPPYDGGHWNLLRNAAFGKDRQGVDRWADSIQISLPASCHNMASAPAMFWEVTTSQNHQTVQQGLLQASVFIEVNGGDEGPNTIHLRYCFSDKILKSMQYVTTKDTT